MKSFSANPLGAYYQPTNQTKMSMFHNEQVVAQWNKTIKDRKANRGKTGDDAEMAVCFNHYHKQFSLLNRGELNEQMTIWKKQRKSGEVRIKRYNSKTAVVDGKEYHFFVVQPAKNGKMVECNFDPMGLFILGELVSGYIYAFTNKGNRDAVEKYVMGKYDDSLDEECDDE